MMAIQITVKWCLILVLSCSSLEILSIFSCLSFLNSLSVSDYSRVSALRAQGFLICISMDVSSEPGTVTSVL